MIIINDAQLFKIFNNNTKTNIIMIKVIFLTGWSSMCPHHPFLMFLPISRKASLFNCMNKSWGTKAPSSSLKRGKSNVRSARRTSVLLQQLTEPEIRSGQLFIKEMNI